MMGRMAETSTTLPPLRESSDPLERALVRAAWHEIHVMENVREAPAQKLYQKRWEAVRDQAHELFTPHEGSQDMLSPHMRRLYESPANVTRFRRTVQYLEPGDRVLEIGIGKGYLATTILTEGQLDGYLGLDLVQSNADATKKMLAANGVGANADARVGDLYDLTRADAEAIDASFVICCEVLEHVPDPEQGLKVLADALPAGAELLFSTPLLGRLEGVWGHTAMFGVERIRRMLRGAGLVAHHVEALHNTWVSVLASKSEEPSSRTRALVSHDLDIMDGIDVPAERPQAVRNAAPAQLERTRSVWARRMDQTLHGGDGQPLPAADARTSQTGSAQPNAGPLRITATPTAGAEGAPYIGVAFPTPTDTPPRGVRLELQAPDLDQFQRLYVELRKDREVIARWTWVPSERRPKAQNPTFMLTDGTKGGFFRRSPSYKGDFADADTVEVFARVQDGSDAELTISRFGWVV